MAAVALALVVPALQGGEPPYLEGTLRTDFSEASPQPPYSTASSITPYLQYENNTLADGRSRFTFGDSSPFTPIGPVYVDALPLPFHRLDFGYTFPAVRLTFYNGTVTGESLVSSVRVDFTFDYYGLNEGYAYIPGSEETYVLVNTINFFSTPNLAGNTPKQNADACWFDGHPENAFWVYENSTATADVLFKRGSFTFEGFDPASVTGSGFVAPVPEPVGSSVALGLVGLIATLAHRRRPKRVGSHD